MKKQKFRKYSLNKIGFVLSSIIFGLMLVLFVTMLVITSINEKDKIGIGLFDTLLIIKELSLICLTIFGGALISAFLIERRNKNNEYVTTIANEVVCDNNFLKYLSDENRDLLKSRLSGFSYDSQAEIAKCICDKLSVFKYYYDECSVDVLCDVKKEFIEKTITKTTKIKSFSKTHKISNYRLLSSSFKKGSETCGLTVINIVVDGRSLIENVDFVIKTESITSNEKVLLRNGYNTRCFCELVNDLILKSDKITEITVEYRTTVKDDAYFTNRLSGPCKKYYLKFAISDNKKSNYDICGSAFGFMESGERTPNQEQNHFEIKINSWCFKDDGVSLSYKKSVK
ncbi:MAG: hypothetical protein MJ227_02435 [Bacilli bacterium]|nr:hypothetical protein [Bacilli bacterium]